ncbi:very short patch repair endonuclease [Ammoniphilus oxalaticus]|uniref:Very short patch repair endonuclease n=1 Tax=Ammoniphilus oxalaticus TaxID=66863 RepID=A0A419SP27_9BACL|nr:very short patch repair endonuclease [Ammoniphilus oxalaticus]RKD26015.1 very short patch repair endonuclease [Ammoniphilus oxalaticus]
MADKITRQQRSNTMRAVRSQGTKLEQAVTKRLWTMGFRFRKNVQKLFGKPDLAIQKYKVVLFIDSCFWHGCPLHCRMPQSNTAYWQQKIERNRTRDEEVDSYYHEKGWKLLRIWEHDLKEDFEGTIERIASFMKEAKTRST